jgi:hypothetical protein
VFSSSLRTSRRDMPSMTCAHRKEILHCRAETAQRVERANTDIGQLERRTRGAVNHHLTKRPEGPAAMGHHDRHVHDPIQAGEIRSSARDSSKEDHVVLSQSPAAPTGGPPEWHPINARLRAAEQDDHQFHPPGAGAVASQRPTDLIQYAHALVPASRALVGGRGCAQIGQLCAEFRRL